MALPNEAPVGGKSAGLYALQADWTLPFVVLTDEIHQIFTASDGSVALRELVGADLHYSLASQLEQFGENPEDIALLVRSDAADEDLSERGQLSSHKSDGTVDGVLDAAEQVFRDAPHPGRRIGLILQRSVGVQASGHFSNELRISKDSRRWLCEIVNGPFNESTGAPKQKAMTVQGAATAEPGPLLCGTRAEIFSSLRRIGKYFHDQRLRRHLEWVWDGRRLWIVQNDADKPVSGMAPVVASCAPHSRLDARELHVLSKFDTTEETPWQKLRCVSDFVAAGMPATSLYFATGELIHVHIKAGTLSESLAHDLNLLLDQPLVIRTDIRGETAFLLARTDTVSTVEAAVGFMSKVLSQTLNSSRSLEDVCFIIHRFIPAAASAFSFAKPSNRRVRIDSIWGLPDGLEFCSHDSYEVDAKSQKLLDKRIRFKSTFLANLPTGEWKEANLAPPYNWMESLTSADLQRIATSSHKLAEEKQAAIVIMWLARIPAASGHPDLLPWRLTKEDAPREVAAAASSHFFGTSFKIRNDQDISELQRRSSSISSVVFRPDEPHLRDEAFLNRLAHVATELNLPINLEGSFLSHAYYVLRKAGAHVACIDPIDPQPVKTRFRKLVRDRIPVKIERSGESAETTTLLRPELLEMLRTKLVEESLEVLNAATDPSLYEEMADVYEVLRAMCNALGRSMIDVAKDAEKKREALGGFQNGVILVETKDMPLIAVDESPALFTSTSASRKVDVQQIIGVAGRKAKSQIDRILLPLVPPVPSRHRGAIRVEIRQLNAHFKIVYSEKSVEIILDGSVRPNLRGQLDLFPKRELNAVRESSG
jgi:predicted house-cleaning noncanonical NTP pyrophosphatase (MazG superfamily)